MHIFGTTHRAPSQCDVTVVSLHSGGVICHHGQRQQMPVSLEKGKWIKEILFITVAGGKSPYKNSQVLAPSGFQFE